MNQDRLADEIGAWDGKTAGFVNGVYAQFQVEPQFGGWLVTLLEKRPLQKGASWLLKKHLEQGNPLDEPLLSQLFTLLPRLAHWETKLHLLQSLDHLIIPASSVRQVEQFVHDCLTSKKKFVRAWAYSGFYRLAQQHPTYEAEVMTLLDRAMSDEAPSVRARVRQLWKR